MVCSAIAAMIATSTSGYVPLTLGHLRNAQATLLENLHALQNTAILCVLLELLKLDHLGKLSDEFDMYETPLWFLTVRLLVEVGMIGIEGRLWTKVS